MACYTPWGVYDAGGSKLLMYISGPSHNMQSGQIIKKSQPINQYILMSWRPSGGQQTIKAYSEYSHKHVYGLAMYHHGRAGGIIDIVPSCSQKQAMKAISLDTA